MALSDTGLTHYTDPLTALPSARAWPHKLARAVADARADGRPLEIALVDVDRFDVIASADPQAADRLLKSLAARWTDVTDLCARTGVSRFAFAVPGGSADLLRDTLSQLPDGVTLSIGLARWRGERPASLTTRAERALERAKLHGRDRAVIAG